MQEERLEEQPRPDTDVNGDPAPDDGDAPLTSLSGIPAAAPGSRAQTAGLPARQEPVAASGERGDRAALELAHQVVDLASDKKASDIVLLDVGALTTLADYFVICSGGSERQLNAIADGIVEGLREGGVRAIGREGAATAHWVLIDLGSVIVHIFAPPERDYYQLERLWSEAPLLLRVQ